MSKIVIQSRYVLFVIRVIDSCETWDQYWSAMEWCERIYKDKIPNEVNRALNKWLTSP